MPELCQDEVYSYLLEGESREKIRLHDYDRICEVSGLYEQVVYERLKCRSPRTVVEVLRYAVSQSQRLNELRVLDLGAGNGIAGEELNPRARVPRGFQHDREGRLGRVQRQADLSRSPR